MAVFAILAHRSVSIIDIKESRTYLACSSASGGSGDRRGGRLADAIQSGEREMWDRGVTEGYRGKRRLEPKMKRCQNLPRFGGSTLKWVGRTEEIHGWVHLDPWVRGWEWKEAREKCTGNERTHVGTDRNGRGGVAVSRSRRHP